MIRKQIIEREYLRFHWYSVFRKINIAHVQIKFSIIYIRNTAGSGQSLKQKRSAYCLVMEALVFLGPIVLYQAAAEHFGIQQIRVSFYRPFSFIVYKCFTLKFGCYFLTSCCSIVTLPSTILTFDYSYGFEHYPPAPSKNYKTHFECEVLRLSQ